MLGRNMILDQIDRGRIITEAEGLVGPVGLSLTVGRIWAPDLGGWIEASTHTVAAGAEVRVESEQYLGLSDEIVGLVHQNHFFWEQGLIAPEGILAPGRPAVTVQMMFRNTRRSTHIGAGAIFAHVMFDTIVGGTNEQG